MNIELNTIGLNTIGLNEVQMPCVGEVQREVHHLHYILADRMHYVTQDGEYYKCRE